MERPWIKFGYDGDWVLRAQQGAADRSRHRAAEYEGTDFAGKFVPSPIDCKPWVDAQVGGWDIFFSQDLCFMITDVQRGLFGIPKEMDGRIGAFGPFHIGVYSGVRIKTARGWVAMIDRVADPKVRESLPFTTETAILETDWYTWIKNFVVIKPNLSRLSDGDVVNIARGTPLCRVRVVPRNELITCTEFAAEDYTQLEDDKKKYTEAEIAMYNERRFRASGEQDHFYPLYKLKAAENKMSNEE